MEDKTQKTQITGIVAERKGFRLGHLKMSLRIKSASRFEHLVLKVDSGHIQTNAGKNFGENAAARSNVENR